MKKIMSLVVVALFSVACASKPCSSCASGGSSCDKDKAAKTCPCGKDKASCKNCAG